MNKQNLHQEIREYMLGVINRSQIGDLLPTEKQIAEKFQVSRTTVQNVMLALRREGFLERRKGSGSFVSSKERIVTNNVESSYNGQIIYAYPDFPSMEFNLFRKIIEEKALEQRLNIEELRISRFSNYRILNQLAQKTPHLKGIIMFQSSDMKAEDFDMLNNIGVTVVIIGGESFHNNIVSINPDYNKIGYRVIEHFIVNGHRRFGCIMNEPASNGDKLLLAGMKKALTMAKLPIKSLCLNTEETPLWGDSALAAYTETGKMLKGKSTPSAIFYRSSLGALAGIRAIREAGLNVPCDISVISGSSLFEPMSDYLFPRIGNITCKRDSAVMVAMDAIIHPEKISSHNIIIDVEMNAQESVNNIKEVI